MSQNHFIMLRVRKCPSANWLYDPVSKLASVTGHSSTWNLIAGVPLSLAIRATTAAMLPPTLLPATARRLPSTLISLPCSATHLVAA
ncbi:hypothetical protein D3C73_1321620 [compost metagenome]